MARLGRKVFGFCRACSVLAALAGGSRTRPVLGSLFLLDTTRKKV